MDAQTFQTMMLLNMQQNILPNVWRYVPFDAVLDLAARLEAQPLTDSPNATAGFKLYKRKSVEGDDDMERKFMDWRRAFVVLALMAGRLPTASEKQSYYSKLRAKAAVCEN